jgi:hypothetical protein
MNRTKRMGRLGGLAASAAAVAPFPWLWVLQMNNARDPLTAQARLDMAPAAPHSSPWLPKGYMQDFREAA